MTTSELKMINSNYYNGNSFCRRLHFNTGLIYGTVCYWLKKGIIIFYFANDNILLLVKVKKLFNIGSNIKINVYYKYLFYQTISIIDKHIKNNLCYEYVFCGHSVSAAVATIAAYYTISNNLNCLILYNLITYGSPLVGNKQFSRVIKTYCNVYNYVNELDNIKHLHKYSIILKPILLDNIYNGDPHS